MRKASISWPLRRRLDEAEAAVTERWTRHAAAVVGEALDAAPQSVQVTILDRLRNLHREAWRGGDVVETALREIDAVAPEIAASVRKRLGTEHDEGNR